MQLFRIPGGLVTPGGLPADAWILAQSYEEALATYREQAGRIWEETGVEYVPAEPHAIELVATRRKGEHNTILVSDSIRIPE